MDLHLLRAVAISLSLAAIPPLSVAAAFPSLLVGEAGRDRRVRQGVLRTAALAALAIIFLLVYPSAILSREPFGKEVVHSGQPTRWTSGARVLNAILIENAPGKALSAPSPSTDKRWGIS